MNLLKIKNTIILTIAASAMSLMIFTMLQVFNKPDIKQINIPNIKDIELNSSIDTSDQSVLNSNNSNFDYQLIGYRAGETDYSVILKKGNKEFVVSSGDKLEGLYELVSVNEDEVIFNNQGKIYTIKNSVGK
jgi:type II secretory pathway component PulC